MIYTKGKVNTKSKRHDKNFRVILVTIIVGILSLFGSFLNGEVKGTQTTKPEEAPAVTQKKPQTDAALPGTMPQQQPSITYTPPQSNVPLYVLTNSNATRAYNSAPADQKDRLAKIANTPMGLWQTKSSNTSTFQTSLNDAYGKGHVPIVVLYNIPKIGCGGGGATSLDSYKQWVNARTALITSKTIVVLEPDAVAMFGCLSDADKATRIQALNYAVDELAKTPAVTYVDAGHSSWVAASTMAERLKQVGVTRTRGISVNVSNYQTNADSTSYAQNILNALGAKNLGVVVDTSRNGAGSPADKQWCNALGRKLGTPSAVVNSGSIDAYLWVKVPGESDGTCNGGPAEGQWWNDYALGLAS